MAGPAIVSQGGDVPSGPVKPIVYIVAFAAATAGLLFGLDIGVISGANPFLQKEFSIGEAQIEHIVSALLWGASVGAVGCGWVSSALGRKLTLIIAAIIFVIGSLGCALAHNTGTLVGMRFFLGLAVGMASFVAPLYLSEVAPQRLRGGMVSMYQLMITIGILIASLSDTYFAIYATIGGVTGGHWRWMLGILAVPAGLMLLAVLTLPESPRWLLAKGRDEEARGVLDRIRSLPEEVEAELAAIRQDLAVPQNGFSLFTGNSNFRRAIFLGIALQTIQQLTGINVFMYYSPFILKAAGFTSESQQLMGSVLVMTVNTLSTFIAIAFVDRFGRKPLMYLGFVIMGLAMCTVGTVFHLSPETVQVADLKDQQLTFRCQRTYQQGSTVLVRVSLPVDGVDRLLQIPVVLDSVQPDPQDAHFFQCQGQLPAPAAQLAQDPSTNPVGPKAYISVAALLIFIVGFAASAGPIIWILCSEIYPLNGRDFGVTVSTATNWIVNGIVGATFLTMLTRLGPGNTFIGYGLLEVVFFIFFVLYVPETKGVSLEHISANLLAGKPLREIGAGGNKA